MPLDRRFKDHVLESPQAKARTIGGTVLVTWSQILTLFPSDDPIPNTNRRVQPNPFEASGPRHPSPWLSHRDDSIKQHIAPCSPRFHPTSHRLPTTAHTSYTITNSKAAVAAGMIIPSFQQSNTSRRWRVYWNDFYPIPGHGALWPISYPVLDPPSSSIPSYDECTHSYIFRSIVVSM